MPHGQNSALVISDDSAFVAGLSGLPILRNNFIHRTVDKVDPEETASATLLIYSLEKKLYQNPDFTRSLALSVPGQIRVGVYDTLPSHLPHISRYTHSCFSSSSNITLLDDLIREQLSIRLALVDNRLEGLLSKTLLAPCQANVRKEAIDYLEDFNASQEINLAEIVNRDIGLFSKVLMLANLDTLPRGEVVVNIYDAVARVDKGALQYLVGPSGPLYEPKDVLRRTILSAVTNHSLAVARLALMIAMEEKRSQTEQHIVYSAALLHEIGRLILCECENDSYKQVYQAYQDRNRTLFEEEQQIFHTTYPEIGDRILSLWKIPPVITRLVRHHQAPWECSAGADDLLWILYTANTIVEETSPRGQFDPILRRENFQ